MEVYCQGLPPGLSQASFRSSLQGYMNALGITDWSCQEPGNKDFGFIIFLNVKDGLKFLRQHGATRPQRPRLFIVKKPVYASKGKNAPDKFMLSHLQHHSNQKPTAVDRPLETATPVLPLRGIDCGHSTQHRSVDALVFVRQCYLECDFDATAKFGTRGLILQYDGGFRVDIPYAIIWEMARDPQDSAITLILSEVPRFFAPGRRLADLMDRLDLSAYGWHNTSRAPKLIRAGSLQGCPEHVNYVAHCLVYRLRFWNGYHELTQVLATLRRPDLKQPPPVAFREMPAIPGETDFPSTFRDFTRRTDELQGSGAVPFVILFQTQALVRNNYVSPIVAIGVLNFLESAFTGAKKVNAPHPFSVKSFKLLFQQIPYPSPKLYPQRLSARGIIEQLRVNEVRHRNHMGLFAGLEKARTARQSWVLKAIVTPTRILLQGPDLETNNRILRKFPDHTDYFLRVQFSEEDEEDLFFNPNVSNDMILKRFEDVFRNGIQIAGRVYGFLGFSHSSLRSHSAWFSAAFVDKEGNLQSSITIIRDLGNFSKIRIPARCAARIGQAFSETPYSIHLADHGITQSYMPDVKSPDGVRVFSDGVGTISLEAARAIWDVLPSQANRATCFQIRWAGAKGMLSLDTRLTGRQFRIRKESMEKFEGTDSADLEICDMSSKPMRFFLNQQIIKILEDLHVDESWFLRLQKQELDSLKRITETTEGTAAFLHAHDVGSEADLPKFLKRLHKRKIDYRTDPFLRSLVESVVLRELRLLKHKARIPVRKGVTLFGVMDETGYLEPDEVYVTFDQTSQGNIPNPIENTLKDGVVLVTRSPALHPGDIQVALQKTPPKGHPLRALRNCIIFSQKGDRDLPSKLSGGDLDGDIYNIIWDPEVTEVKRLYAPADYPRTIPGGLDRPVTKEDMANFFVNFMKTDQLGIIATRHLIIADKKNEGTMDSDCLKLAELHSSAVDFSKTGAAVDVSLMPNYKARFRPDFLSPAPLTQVYDRGQIEFLDPSDDRADEEDGPPNHTYYRSEKILGKLYRNVDEKKIWSSIHKPIPYDGPSVWDQMLGVVRKELGELRLEREIQWQREAQMAHDLQEGYEGHVLDMWEMLSPNTTGGLTELEVFSGAIFHKTSKPSQRQRDCAIKLRVRIGEITAWLVDQLRSGPRVQPDAVAAPADKTAVRMRAIELCLACLHISREREADDDAKHMRRGRRGPAEYLQSFRVIAAATLLRELDRYRFDLQETERRQQQETAEATSAPPPRGRRR